MHHVGVGMECSTFKLGELLLSTGVLFHRATLTSTVWPSPQQQDVSGQAGRACKMTRVFDILTVFLQARAECRVKRPKKVLVEPNSFAFSPR